MFRCDQADQGQGPFELYNLSTGEWKPVAISPQIIAYRDACDAHYGVQVVALGSDWIEWDESFRGGDMFVFQSIATSQVQGQLAGWKSGGTTIPNLNSPSVAGRLCSPLQVPEGFDSTSGSLSFYGRFAVAYAWPSGSGYKTTHIYVVTRLRTIAYLSWVWVSSASWCVLVDGGVWVRGSPAGHG